MQTNKRDVKKHFDFTKSVAVLWFCRSIDSTRSNYGAKDYIQDDGTVQNNSYMTIGYARGVKKESAAVAFFFFAFD